MMKKSKNFMPAAMKTSGEMTTLYLQLILTAWRQNDHACQVWSQLSHLVIVVTCDHIKHNCHRLARVTPGPTKNRYYMAIFPNYYQLAKVPLVQPKIGIIWPFSQNYNQLPEVLLVQPKIGMAIFPKLQPVVS